MSKTGRGRLTQGHVTSTENPSDGGLSCIAYCRPSSAAVTKLMSLVSVVAKIETKKRRSKHYDI